MNDCKRCPTCQRVMVIYRKSLRKNMLKPLEALFRSDQPLTTQELALAFPPSLGIEITKHFPSLRLFGLIREVEPKKYVCTLTGARFLEGEMPVPEWVYTLNGEPTSVPEDGDVPKALFVHQVAPGSFAERRRHIEEAVPVQMAIPA